MWIAEDRQWATIEGGVPGGAATIPSQRVGALHNLFRHRSDTIGNVLVSQVLDIMVGVAGFEPATPSSRTRHPHCKIKLFRLL
jgi:hypothetical protein